MSDWMGSDEWFTDYLHRLEASPSRLRRLRFEGRRIVPVADARARRFEDETEQLRRFLHGRSVGPNTERSMRFTVTVAQTRLAGTSGPTQPRVLSAGNGS